MNDATPSPTPRRGNAFPWLLALLLLALLGWWGWQHWQGLQRERAAAALADDAHWRDLEARVDRLRSDHRAQAQRIAQADATNRVLRDEVLGIGQRAALLEDSVDKLAEPLQRGSAALRLDEVELLLSLGEGRLLLAGDLAAAKRAYAMAAGVLDSIDDPALLDLRQALQQERAELDALEEDPKVLALRRLDGFAAALPDPNARRDTGADADAPWYERAFSRIVQVQPSDRDLSVAPGERAASHAALQLELSLARSAAERRDVAAWQAALGRADALLQRLWPGSPLREGQRDELKALRGLPLAPSLPTLGTTLALLRAGRAAR